MKSLPGYTSCKWNVSSPHITVLTSISFCEFQFQENLIDSTAYAALLHSEHNEVEIGFFATETFDLKLRCRRREVLYFKVAFLQEFQKTKGKRRLLIQFFPSYNCNGLTNDNLNNGYCCTNTAGRARSRPKYDSLLWTSDNRTSELEYTRTRAQLTVFENKALRKKDGHKWEKLTGG
jgi:hypothetical protein